LRQGPATHAGSTFPWAFRRFVALRHMMERRLELG
jgi:hypothetical protein